MPTPRRPSVRDDKPSVPIHPRRFPWEQPGLSRAERVVAFLEFLPITKGILRGKRMALLPHQREFVERVYSGNVRLAVSSVARGNGKTGLIAGLVCCHLFGPEAEPRWRCLQCRMQHQAGIACLC